MNTENRANSHGEQGEGGWDHSSAPQFVDYYAKQSVAEETQHHFELLRDKLLAIRAIYRQPTEQLRVVDVGCGAGTQARIWAEKGHEVFGIDVNAPLIELAESRARDLGLGIRFQVGSATELPYEDGTMDVCLLPELLEHVPDWQRCLTEAFRVLRSGGLLFLSTTNVLCPRQQEFDLPLYLSHPLIYASPNTAVNVRRPSSISPKRCTSGRSRSSGIIGISS